MMNFVEVYVQKRKVTSAGTVNSATGVSYSTEQQKQPLGLSLSSAVIYKKDKGLSQIEKLFMKTVKDMNVIQQQKKELEDKSAEYRKQAHAVDLLRKYDECLGELNLVLQGYADKLATYHSHHPLLEKHKTKLRRRSNSVSNPTPIGGATDSSQRAGNNPNSSSFHKHRSNSPLDNRHRSRGGEDAMSTGSHDQHPDGSAINYLGGMNASREEMEHPPDAHYGSDYEGGGLSGSSAGMIRRHIHEEVQRTADMLRAELDANILQLRNDWKKKSDELSDVINTRCNSIETSIKQLLGTKFTELDYDLRERNEMVEQQIGALSEDVRTIDQRTVHRTTDIETTINDRLGSLEARLGEIENSPLYRLPNRNFIDDLQDADTVILAKRIFQSLLVFLISFIFVFMNILKVFSNTISTPKRVIFFVVTFTITVVAYITSEELLFWVKQQVSQMRGMKPR